MRRTRAEARGELPDADVFKILTTMIKQRREASDLYRKGNRPELAEKEEAEIVVIQGYLPKGLTEAELESLARETIASAGASGPGDAGRVMKELMPKVAGRADGKAVSELVRRLLSG